MKAKKINQTDKKLTIGDIFTPLKWGEFAVEKFGIFDSWMNGSTIFDPTMGEGNLLESLITYGISQGFSIHELPTHTLYGNELNTEHYTSALLKFKEKYNLVMDTNFSNEDLLTLERRPYDILLGNPPWQNFVDLPATYKEKLKPYFFSYDLVEKSQSLLLGRSRIDIAALIVQVAFKDFLSYGGEASMFLPLSLLLNDGANSTFRTYKIGQTFFSVESVHDLNTVAAFKDVSTRYGLVHFRRDKEASFPKPYFRWINGEWVEFLSKPIFRATDPLSILAKEDANRLSEIVPIQLTKESAPRQGINTCGANHIFFFDTLEKVDELHVSVSNKKLQHVRLPAKFISPLITAKNFSSEDNPSKKWVLLPYTKHGKPLDWKEITAHPTLENYLMQHASFLKKRKGIMLRSMLKRGCWWALLGVGPYSFFPFKIVWEAYGRSTFEPKLFSGNWHANQSLQAYIPVKNETEATRILSLLFDPKIEEYLLSLKMEGTMNWAQPGKIKKFLELI